MAVCDNRISMKPSIRTFRAADDACVSRVDTKHTSWLRFDLGARHAVNHAAWAIGKQGTIRFHVRRIVWGHILAREEKRDGEQIRRVTIIVGA